MSLNKGFGAISVMLLRYLLIGQNLKKLKGLKRLLFLLLLLVVSQNVDAQFRLILELDVTDKGKRLPGAEIKVYKGSTLVETVLTDSKGKADIPLAANGLYTIDIGGNKGMVKKKLSVDTRNVAPENAQGDIPYPALVELFEKIDGLDLTILNKPIGKIEYNSDFSDFGANIEYTKSIQKQLAQLEKDFVAKEKETAAAAAGKQKQYDAAIKIADKAFANEDWEVAELQYKAADQVKPDPFETYPSFQLAELETKLIKIRADNKKYAEAIKKADAASASKNYEIAVSEYKRATGYKPKESYPQTKLKETQNLLANAAKIEQDYLAAIEKGDNALKVNDMNTAKAAFSEAIGYKAGETYPKNKIAEIDDILAKAGAKLAKYDAAIKAADEAVKVKDYTAATAEYTKAKELKPLEKYPVEQLAKVSELVAAAAKTEQGYLAAIEKGDNSLQANKYAEAKIAFESAAQLKPAEAYPKDKIKEINDFITKNEATDKQYKDKITTADKALASKDYEGAKSAYNEAKTLKPKETYPQQKLTEIDGLIAEIAKLEENYKKAIVNGDKALAAKDFETAKSAYTKASNLKPEEQYPKDKLVEIDTIVLSNQQSEANYSKAIQNGEDALGNKDLNKAKEFFNEAAKLKPREQLPKDKLATISKILEDAAALDKNYTSSVAEGDKAMGEKDLESAKASYTKALSLKPEETYPQDQLGKIDAELDKLAAEKENAAKLEVDYQTAIKEGDKAFSGKDLALAKSAFEKALGLKADETYPKEKIIAINSELEALAGQEKSYSDAIAEGDKALESKDFDAAKANYTKALSFKPEETYPKDQLVKIKVELEKIAENKANASKLEEDYQVAIKEGDAAFSIKDLAAAKSAFEKAIGLKTDEVYPKERITAINSELDALAGKEKSYTSAIAEGDKAMGAKDFEASKVAFTKALSFKPEETYPQDQLVKIDTELEKLATEKANLEKLEAAYNIVIEQADKAFAEKNFDEALTNYNKALTLKLGESYPTKKIEEINDAKDALASENAKAEEAAEIQKKYDALILKADAYLEEKKLEEAKKEFQAALNLKSDESYPKEKLVEIDKSLLEFANNAKNELDYQSAISKGDQAFTAKEYEKAKAGYLKALSVKPEETYPQDQLGKIDQALVELANSNEAEADYQSAIITGDNAFTTKDYETAKASYLKALSIKPEETYPQDQLTKIDNNLAEEAEAENIRLKNEKANEIDLQYQTLISEGDGFVPQRKWDEAISKYEEALKVMDKQEAKDKIADVKKMKADALADETAKLEALKLKDLENEYVTLIEKGELQIGLEQYESAKELFNEALTLKDEQLPKDKIAEIDAKLANLESNKVENDRLEKLEREYNTAIKNGDQSLATKDFTTALKSFKKAQILKPDETYSPKKIQEINQMIATASAADAAKLAAVDEKYNRFILTANTALENREYDVALTNYDNAQSVKPNETLPIEKIDEIKGILAKLAADAESIRIRKDQEIANQAAYATAIAAADKYFLDKKWNDSENEYRLAKGLKASETYPQEQLDKIKAILAKQNAAKRAANKAKKDANSKEKLYKELITKGDEQFQTKKYKAALSSFKKALGIKPTEAYPKSQIDIINGLLEKVRLAEEEKRKELDKPISIQTGPKATINGDAEAELDKLYEEIWAKQNSDKSSPIDSQIKLIDSLNRIGMERDDKQREAALEYIEGIQVSMNISVEESPKFHLQNYETVKLQEENLSKYYEKLNVEAERIRNNNAIDQVSFYAELAKYNQLRNQQLVEGKKEAIEKSFDDNATIEAKRVASQSDRMLNAYTKNENLKKAIKEFNQEIYDNFYMENLAVLQKDEKNYDKITAENSKDALERRETELKKSDDQLQEIRQFGQKNAESFKNNQLIIEEQEKTLKEISTVHVIEAEKRRKEQESKEFYQGEKKVRQDQSAADYPQGVTEEIIENQNNSTTIKRVVVDGTQTDMYEKTLYKWGGVFYTKNGNNVTRDIWDKETR